MREEICVFCGASPKVPQSHLDTGYAFGGKLSEHRFDLVYGGGGSGMMGAVARGVRDGGGHITGIIPHFLREWEEAYEDIDELILTETMHQRKAHMAERAQQFVILPGGIGTLDEMCEIITWFQLEVHAKPIHIVDFDGYWGPLLTMLQHISDMGYLQSDYDNMFHIHDDIIGCMVKIEDLRP
ncbi:MAG: TIGR00730 family Rossman fold protein [Pseudomonadota bacterium]